MLITSLVFYILSNICSIGLTVIHVCLNKQFYAVFLQVIWMFHQQTQKLVK